MGNRGYVITRPSGEEANDWTPQYSSWRHGGWYVDNVRYPSGAVGCVSRNYPDRMWRIVCDPRSQDHTYRSRDAAARAEYAMARELVRASEYAAPDVPVSSPPFPRARLDTFTRAYLAAALWSSLDSESRPLDRRFTLSDFAPATLAAMAADCAAFQRENAADLALAGDDAKAGHDFWLTRGHHGVGFWSTHDGPLGQRLTAAAHAFGEQDLLAEDGQLVAFPLRPREFPPPSAPAMVQVTDDCGRPWLVRSIASSWLGGSVLTAAVQPGGPRGLGPVPEVAPTEVFDEAAQRLGTPPPRALITLHSGEAMHVAVFANEAAQQRQVTSVEVRRWCGVGVADLLRAPGRPRGIAGPTV